MPKAVSAPISPSEIRAVITKEDAFGHELRVGHIIRGIPSMLVEHGGTYADPVTQKPRQFDYRCSLTKEAQCLSLAVECKNLSSSLPLFVCGTKRCGNEAFHEIIESRRGTFHPGQVALAGRPSGTRRASGQDAFYPPGHFVGKSLTRIETDKAPMGCRGDSDIYDKYAQALSSGVGLVESACGFPEGASSPKFFTAVLPVVVVPDGLLWRVAYDASGSISDDPARVDECEFFVGWPIEVARAKFTSWFHRFTFSHVHFLTLRGFKSFLSKMAINDHAWIKLFTEKSLEL